MAWDMYLKESAHHLENQMALWQSRRSDGCQIQPSEAELLDMEYRTKLAMSNSKDAGLLPASEYQEKLNARMLQAIKQDPQLAGEAIAPLLPPSEQSKYLPSSVEPVALPSVKQQAPRQMRTEDSAEKSLAIAQGFLDAVKGKKSPHVQKMVDMYCKKFNFKIVGDKVVPGDSVAGENPSLLDWDEVDSVERQKIIDDF
jgi:hypothetical protein